jgi:hypothetical protein
MFSGLRYRYHRLERRRGSLWPPWGQFTGPNPGIPDQASSPVSTLMQNVGRVLLAIGWTLQPELNGEMALDFVPGACGKRIFILHTTHHAT